MASPASAAERADAIMRDLAQNQTHSWVDDAIGFPAMMEKYKAGERLYVTCGNVAEIARELLRDAGLSARVVQVITEGDFDYFNDGHLMTEVFTDGRWQLYDPDGNVRAVDENGQGVSVVDQVEAVKAGTARWETIANDPLYRDDEPNQELRDFAARIFSDPAAFYRHVMGVALLPSDPAGTVTGRMYYHDASQVAHLTSYTSGSRAFVSDAIWNVLTTTDQPAPPLPAPSTPSRPVNTTAPEVAAPPPALSAPRPTPATPPRLTAAHAKSCSLRGRQVRTHEVSCRSAKRVLRRFVATGKAPRQWVCKGRRIARSTNRAASARVRLQAHRRAKR